jgi:hypothetical protein
MPKVKTRTMTGGIEEKEKSELNLAAVQKMLRRKHGSGREIAKEKEEKEAESKKGDKH